MSTSLQLCLTVCIVPFTSLSKPSHHALTTLSPCFHIKFTSTSPRLHLNFTSTSPQLHLNFTSTSPQLHLNFTSTSPQLHLNFTSNSPYLHFTALSPADANGLALLKYQSLKSRPYFYPPPFPSTFFPPFNHYRYSLTITELSISPKLCARVRYVTKSPTL